MSSKTFPGSISLNSYQCTSDNSYLWAPAYTFPPGTAFLIIFALSLSPVLKSFLISSPGLVWAGSNGVQICHPVKLFDGTYHSFTAYHSYLETDLLYPSGFCSPWGKNLRWTILCLSEHPKHIVDAKNIWRKNNLYGPYHSFCFCLKQLISKLLSELEQNPRILNELHPSHQENKRKLFLLFIGS